MTLMPKRHTKNLSPLKIYILIFMLTSINFSLFAQNWNQIIKATAEDRVEEGHFGFSVAINGDYAVVGSVGADKDTLSANAMKGSGAAYIFKRTGTNWVQEAKITANDRAPGDHFGVSVDINGDYVIVGAWTKNVEGTGISLMKSAGAAYIFKRTGTTWKQEAKIVASDIAEKDQFGISVAISGNYAIVGAYTADKDAAGANIVYDAGAAYIFKRTGTTWTQEAKVVAGDRATVDLFGYSVAINGDYAFVGAVGEDEDAIGANSVKDVGAVYVFKRTGTTWVEETKIVAKDRGVGNNFGNSLATSGDYLIVGAYFDDKDVAGTNLLNVAGSAYIFKRTGTTWVQEAKIAANDRASGDQFGISVGISGEYAIVGAYFQAKDAVGLNYAERAGAAYIFKHTGTTWVQDAKITSADRARDDFFGRGIAISGSYALIGAWLDDKDAATMNTRSNTGSVYFFTPSSIKPIEKDSQKIFKVYPTLTNSTLIVIREPAFKDNEYFQIINVLGQVMMNIKATREIDVSNLPQGAFFLRVGDVQVKFVKH